MYSNPPPPHRHTHTPVSPHCPLAAVGPCPPLCERVHCCSDCVKDQKTPRPGARGGWWGLDNPAPSGGVSCLDPGCTPLPQSRVCSLEPRPSGDLGSNTSSGPHVPGDPELTASPLRLRLLPRQMGVWPADLSEPSGSGTLGGPQGCSRGGSWGPIARLLLGGDSCPSHQEGQSRSRSGGEE